MMMFHRARLSYALMALLFLIVPLSSAAQSGLWADVAEASILQRAERQIIPHRYRTVQLNRTALANLLSSAPATGLSGVRNSTTIIDLPMPDGSWATFRFVEASIMEAPLQAKFPNIRTYSGQGVTDPSTTLSFDNTPSGFHAMVLGGPNGAVFIDPYTKSDTRNYISYYKKDFQKQLDPGFAYCNYEQVNNVPLVAKETRRLIQQLGSERVGDCQLRTYRLAVATTGEYSNFHGSNTTNNDKSFAMNAITTTMLRVNGIYQRDATLTMMLVANNDLIVFLDGGSDPYSNGNGGAMLGENQAECDGTIMSANYDIGHVFSTGGGGVASLNSPCSSTRKAQGVTGQGSPVGDPFDIDYVAHEMGHQFGGNHTQNNSCNRSNASYEPGSASSIMGYAGICSPNVQSNSDALFHGYSMQEIAANITAGTSSTCPVVTSAGNAAPIANAGNDHIIPASTPFVLSGVGTDGDAGDVLSFTWEQMDNQVSTQPPSATSTNGPNFRTYVPSASPDRYLPRLSDLVIGTDYDWEVLSSVTRTFNFRLTVRDNAAGSGCNDQDNMQVDVDGGSGPFVVTAPNTAVIWTALQSETVSWNVANTTNAPVSAANVDIFLSEDGGLTYPHTLVLGTPNDGSESVTVPNVPTANARIMVKGNGSIFFDISDEDFTVQVPSVPDYSLDATPTSITVCQPLDAQYNVSIGSIIGYSDPVTLSTANLPAGSTASFSVNPVTPGGTSVLTISNTSSVSMGTYGFDLNGSSTSGGKTVALSLTVNEGPAQTILSTPADGATGVIAGTPLTWTADALSNSYSIQIATDAAMVNVVESSSGIATTTYTPTVATAVLTTYFWQVRGTNGCGDGAWAVVHSFTTAECFPVTVNIVLDRYGEDTSWEVRDGGTTYASGGPYTQSASNGEYPQPPVNICLPVGCYELVVNDVFGDGNCCTYGNGTINVTDASSQILAEVARDIDQGVPAIENFCVTSAQVVQVAGKIFLEGPFESGSGLMKDDLRTTGSIPSTEPYTPIYGHVNGGGGETVDAGVLAITGSNAIVDWVYVELRDQTDATSILATRSALVQRDGDVVDMDGTSPVLFNVSNGNYIVALRHRNHLATMSPFAITPSSGIITYDATTTASSSYGTDAKKQVGSVFVLWTGNVVVDGELKYTGGDNDRDPILVRVGGSVPTATTTGYHVEDTNMDGTVKYTGGDNDRDLILVNIGGGIPTATRQEQLP